MRKRLVCLALGSVFALGLIASPAMAAEASANGNGKGKAVGKPAAGSVGNADDKRPAGQTCGDANSGYEGDRNHGVGRSNPAHTPDPCPVESSPAEELPPPDTYLGEPIQLM